MTYCSSLSYTVHISSYRVINIWTWPQIWPDEKCQTKQNRIYSILYCLLRNESILFIVLVVWFNFILFIYLFFIFQCLNVLKNSNFIAQRCERVSVLDAFKVLTEITQNKVISKLLQSNDTCIQSYLYLFALRFSILVIWCVELSLFDYLSGFARSQSPFFNLMQCVIVPLLQQLQLHMILYYYYYFSVIKCS